MSELKNDRLLRALLRQPGTGLLRQAFVDLYAGNPIGQMRQAGGDEAAAGAYLQHLIAGLHRQCLQHAPFYLRAHHGLTMAEGDLDVRERQIAIGLGDEGFPR